MHVALQRLAARAPQFVRSGVQRISPLARVFEEELADVFSWLHALMLKIRHVYYRDAQVYFQSLLSQQPLLDIRLNLVDAISLADIIWSKYGVDRDGNTRKTLCCSGCFCAPCRCHRDLKICWGANGAAQDSDSS